MQSSSLVPAGKAVALEKRPGGVWLRAHVVEPTAVRLVKEGVYQAFSIGVAKPRIVRDAVAKNGRVVDGVFSEVSLVDFPANPHSRFAVAKLAWAAPAQAPVSEDDVLRVQTLIRHAWLGSDHAFVQLVKAFGPDAAAAAINPHFTGGM
ncbi:HK97 family phage prohead protease [Sinomonas soli]